jgi:hypothetical protein
MSRILKDAEMMYFVQELQNTPAGARYRRAWDQAQRALKAVYSINAESTSSEFAKDAVRRLYIARAEEASLALSVLVKLHRWPVEAQAHEQFTFRPPGSASPRRRTDP